MIFAAIILDSKSHVQWKHKKTISGRFRLQFWEDLLMEIRSIMIGIGKSRGKEYSQLLFQLDLMKGRIYDTKKINKMK